jgi:uroporphyrinogen decarboxylase
MPACSEDTSRNSGGPPSTGRLTRGEFELEPGLVAALLDCQGTVGFAEEVAARELLNMDLLALTPQAVLQEQGNGSYRDNWGRLIVKQGTLATVQAPAIAEGPDKMKKRPPLFFRSLA